MAESYIEVYFAGYLVKKAMTKYLCHVCHRLWVATPQEREELQDEFVFFEFKQFDTLDESKGLTAPSKIVLQMTKKLEKTFAIVFKCILAVLAH